MVAVVEVPDIVRQQLRSGESPRWIGRPDPKRFALRQGAANVLFGIPFIGVALYMVFRALASGDWQGELAGLALLAISVTLLASPLYYALVGSRTVSVATDQWLMILNGLIGGTAQSFEPEEIGRIDRTERSDGSGSLVFRRQRYRDSEGDLQTKKSGFFAIPEVREAERHLVILKERRS
jgi:hypothetical protein